MGRVQVSGWGCVLLALALLVLPISWLLAAVTAALFHELCHGAAAVALGGSLGDIRLGERGATMEVGGLSNGRELLAAAAGPVGSLGLLLLGRCFPRLALCGLFQGLYNLLPIYPLDGGRMLCSALKEWLPAKAEKITLVAGKGTGCLLLAGALAALLCRQPGIALLLGATAIRSGALGKIPCKRRGKAVQ